jgi:hypothetical protein
MYPYVQTPHGITVVVDTVPTSIPTSHVNYEAILTGLAAGEDIAPLLDVKQAISTYTNGLISVEDRRLTFNGRELTGAIVTKIIEFVRSDNQALAAPLCAFLTNLMDNPSHRVLNGLYEWISKSGMPITPDGHLLAWRIVRNDYKDYYTGTYDYSVGNVVTEPRNWCDEDPDQTCSSGLHFCSYDYLPHFGGTREGGRRILVVKINPRDVVAIPRDYNTAKGRCCRMEVINEVPEDKIPDFFKDSPLVHFDRPEPAVGQLWRDVSGDYAVVVERLDDDKFLVRGGAGSPGGYSDSAGYPVDADGVHEFSQCLYNLEMYICDIPEILMTSGIRDVNKLAELAQLPGEWVAHPGAIGPIIGFAPLGPPTPLGEWGPAETVLQIGDVYEWRSFKDAPTEPGLWLHNKPVLRWGGVEARVCTW